MELRHIYQIAEAINTKLDIGENGLKDMVITVMVSPTTHFAIDKEFYRLTYDTTDGFEHSEVINATIDGISFKILDKTKNS